jgi:integrase
MRRANCPTKIDEEKVLASLGTYPASEQCLLVLTLETGLRLNELCRLTVGSVWRNGACVPILRGSRRHGKGGRGRRAPSVREIPLNEQAQEFLSRYLEERERKAPLWPLSPLFPGRDGRRSLSQVQAWRIIRRIFLQAGCDPAKTWAAGSLRRRFVRRIYEATNIEIARRCIQHASAITTAMYIRGDEDAESAAEAILALGRARCVHGHGRST